MQEVTRIIAVRHGETDWNVATRLQGHMDIPLNTRGHWQAQQLAQALADEPITAIYTSDLQRAHVTGLAVSATTGAPVVQHRGLRERGFGIFEGQTFAEVEANHPEMARLWRTRVPDFAPPGGESLQAVRQRVTQVTQTLAQQHMGGLVLWVSHGGVLDALYRLATQQPIQAPRTWQLTNTAINRLLWTPQGITLIGWADTSHLIEQGNDDTTT